MSKHLSKGEQKKYVFWAAIALLVVLSYIIIKPYLIALISAFILAYLIKPAYDFLEKRTNKPLAGILSVLIILALIIIPISLLVGELTQQLTISTQTDNVKTSIQTFFSSEILNKLNVNSEFLSTEISEFSVSLISSTLKAIPKIFISLIIILLGIYYIPQNWDRITSLLTSYIPFKEKKSISKQVGSATRKIVYGYALVGLIEFVIALIGFYIAGVKFFILLPILIGLLAFIPAVGPILIWAPLAIFHFLTGNLYTAIGVLITGLIISIIIDNIIAPKLVGSSSRIHPLIMLVGVLGGITLFGLFGFIIGPLVLIYTIKILEETID